MHKLLIALVMVLLALAVPVAEPVEPVPVLRGEVVTVEAEPVIINRADRIEIIFLS